MRALVASVCLTLGLTSPARAHEFVIYFESGGVELDERGLWVATDAVAQVKGLGSARVRIIAHTDGVGSDAANDRLSRARARSIAEVMVRLGVPAATIALDGRGEREPSTPAPDGEPEPLNRRAVILVEPLG